MPTQTFIAGEKLEAGNLVCIRSDGKAYGYRERSWWQRLLRLSSKPIIGINVFRVTRGRISLILQQASYIMEGEGHETHTPTT